jgi:tRNA dimethylallyltransferase
MNLFNQIENFLQCAAVGNKPALIVVLGPTASGKSSLCMKIAHAFNGEVINADSRQIYKEMNIGTAKPRIHEQEGIRHHLYDIIYPDSEFTVADYKRLALKTIEDIHRRKCLPILCGGTGLYISAVIENYQLPAIPPQLHLREKYDKILHEQGSEALHKLLAEKDPATANQIHPNNSRYVIRALEINEIGGINKQDRRGENIFNTFLIGIEWPRDILYERINARTEEQIADGLVNEVKTLLIKGYSEKLPSMSSLGYPEIIAYIKGEIALPEAMAMMQQNVRNYAKRQMTWLRRYRDIHWISYNEIGRTNNPAGIGIAADVNK